MTISFYKNNEPYYKLSKTLENPTDIECLLKSSTDVINPTLTLKRNGVCDFNYCYIPKLKRYYFIVSQNIIRNELLELRLKEDVLMSFKSDILNGTAKLVFGESYNKMNCQIDTEFIYNLKKIDFEVNPYKENGQNIMIVTSGNELTGV